MIDCKCKKPHIEFVDGILTCTKCGFEDTGDYNERGNDE